ncbi:hypothetical protein TSUD_09140 [Trifolium subterraneum]|nr:hypothetical protein TSUD_09140 [Trifolium subterraneum]
MLAYGVLPNVFTYNALILAQLKSGNIRKAYSLKEKMPASGLRPDVVTYNLLIGDACNSERLDLAWKLLDEMQRRGCEPDLITYTELIKGFCIRRRVKKAEELYARILKSAPIMPITLDVTEFQVLGKQASHVSQKVTIFLKVGLFIQMLVAVTIFSEEAK